MTTWNAFSPNQQEPSGFARLPLRPLPRDLIPLATDLDGYETVAPGSAERPPQIVLIGPAYDQLGQVPAVRV